MFSFKGPNYSNWKQTLTSKSTRILLHEFLISCLQVLCETNAVALEEGVYHLLSHMDMGCLHWWDFIRLRQRQCQCQWQIQIWYTQLFQCCFIGKWFFGTKSWHNCFKLLLVGNEISPFWLLDRCILGSRIIIFINWKQWNNPQHKSSRLSGSVICRASMSSCIWSVYH